MNLALVGTTSLAVLVMALSAPSIASGESTTAAREDRNSMRAIPWCTSPGQWNCIESVEYLLDGQWRKTDVVYAPSTGGAVVESPGLIHEMDRTQIRAEAFERYDVDGTEHPAYQLQLQAWPHGKILWDPVFPYCDASKEGQGNPVQGTDPCIRGPWLADTSYRMTFRSSRFKPILAMTAATDMETTYEQIRGGVRFSLSGRPGASQMTYGWGPGAKADKVDAISYEWAGLITDARGANALRGGCDGLGIATAYSNGYGGRMPEWNAATGSLSFGVGGRHYAPDGSIYRGQAEIFVPGELARCMWQVDPRQVSRMEVEVYTENGVEAAGTKSVGYDVKADVVKIIAIDFTYSKKQIVARPTPVKAQPGKRACNAAKTMCVTVDRSRTSARVTMTRVKGTSEVTAVALRGAREEKGTQTRGWVSGGQTSFTVSLSGRKSKGQVWVLRTPSTFISSFQVG